MVIGGAGDGSRRPRGRGGREEPTLRLVEGRAGGRRPFRVRTHPSRRRIDQLLLYETEVSAGLTAYRDMSPYRDTGYSDTPPTVTVFGLKIGTA